MAISIRIGMRELRFIAVFLHFPRSSSSRINSLFLLHSLMLSKSQPNALCHLDVSTSAIFRAGCFRLVHCFGAERTDATIKATCDQGIVHSKSKRGKAYNISKQASKQKGGEAINDSPTSESKHRYKYRKNGKKRRKKTHVRLSFNCISSKCFMNSCC